MAPHRLIITLPRHCTTIEAPFEPHDEPLNLCSGSPACMPWLPLCSPLLEAQKWRLWPLLSTTSMHTWPIAIAQRCRATWARERPHRRTARAVLVVARPPHGGSLFWWIQDGRGKATTVASFASPRDAHSPSQASLGCPGNASCICNAGAAVRSATTVPEVFRLTLATLRIEEGLSRFTMTPHTP